MRLLLSSSALALVLGACSPSQSSDTARASQSGDGPSAQPTENTSTEGGSNERVEEDATPEFYTQAGITSYAVSERSESSPETLRAALEGEAFSIVFDRCPYDDYGWQEEADPLAGLHCGYRYDAQVDGDELVIEGPLEPLGVLFESRISAETFTTTQIVVWGITFTLDQDGVVLDSSEQPVGALVLR